MDHLRCGRCKTMKPPTDYYVRKGRPDTAWCKECYREWHRARYTPRCGTRHGEQRDCGWCGETYVVKQRRTSAYCSRSCKQRARHERLRVERESSKPDRQCVHCGAAMPRTMRADAKFCSEHCNDAAHQVTRKMAKRAGTGRPDVLVSRAGIAERDGWRCGICGGRVARGKKYPDPMCASIDHIIPLSHGGGNGVENLRLTHLRCNIARRDRATDDQLMIVG